MKRVIIITILFCAARMGDILAQEASDALLLSQYYSGGTARSAGMSGAFGALGGDLSVLSTNPAGLGVYRGSEFTFTPAILSTNVSSKFDNAKFNERNLKMVFNNVGYVYTRNFFNQKGLQSINFGFAYNKLSDFKADAYIDVNANSSMLDYFVMYANGYVPDDLDPWRSQLAYDSYAIDTDNNKVYYSDYDDFGYYGQPMVRSTEYRGGIGEYDISLGANINHQWYLGFTWGIQNTLYEENYSHEESPRFQEASYSGHILQSFTYNSQYMMSGWGMNAKIGVIYRPMQLLRFGLSVHTPTHNWMRNEWTTDMSASFNRPPASDQSNVVPAESPLSENKFRVSTPWRYNASAAVLFGDIALIDVDAEFVNYSSISMMPDRFYHTKNQNISREFANALNLKIGAEFRLGPVSLRAGTAYYGSPYKDSYKIENIPAFDNEVKNKATFCYSGGIGYRTSGFYLDAAYSYMKYPKYYDDMYEIPGKIVSSVFQKSSGKFLLTFGFRF